MKFVNEIVKEGYVAFVFGLAQTENPYDKNDIKHWDWSTGHVLAKSVEADKHPDEIQTQHPDYEENVPVAELDIAAFLAAEQMDLDNRLTLGDYMAWLDSLDPRIKEVALLLDNEHPTGHIGARQQYYGQLEVMLLTRCTSGEDFVEMYSTLLSGPFAYAVQEHRREATRIWNITAASIKEYFDRISNKFKET